MKKVVSCLALAAAGAFGSTIVNVSTVVGQTYTVAISNAATTGASMIGMIITAHFASGGDLVCTWTSSGSCSNATGGGFSVTYPAATNTSPLNSGTDWTITNSRTGIAMTSIDFNGIPGLTAFDRCMSGTNTFNDTGTTIGNCGTEGTTGSNLGYSVGTGTGGSSGITGTVIYTNELHLASIAAVGDEWGKFTLTFGGTTFSSGRTFTFRSDSDTLSSAIADTPEPGTFGMMGAALLLLGLKLKSHTWGTTRG